MRYVVFYLALLFTFGALAEKVPLPKKFTVKTEKGDIIISDIDLGKVTQQKYKEKGIHQELNLVLFDLALWEGSLVEAVDQRTGKRLTLLDLPVAAPNFQKFFVCHEDLSQYTNEAFIIYARGKGVAWSEIFKVERPCLKARWENDSKVFVTLIAGRNDEDEPVPAKEESYCLVKELFKICK